MNRLKFVLLAVMGAEFISILLLLFVIKESTWSLEDLITYDRLRVFLYVLMMLFIWSIYTHYRILRNINLKKEIDKQLINGHLIAGVLISVCVSFIIAAISTSDKTVTFELEDIVLGISIFINLIVANCLVSKQIKHYRMIKV